MQKDLKCIILTDTYSTRMGYMSNILPIYLSKEKVEVHIITLPFSPYHNITNFKDTYGSFNKVEDLEINTKKKIKNSYFLHVNSTTKILGYFYMNDLRSKLKEIKPDIVYSLNAIGWIPIQAALFKFLFKYKLFTGSHATISSFPLAKEAQNKKLQFYSKKIIRNFIIRYLPGRLVSWTTSKCFVPTIDCGEVAYKFYGVEKKKLELSPLGVDTNIFKPSKGDKYNEIRKVVREKIGINNDSILCIYTGRFSKEKNPLILAQAINLIRRDNLNYFALFIGDGIQKAEIINLEGNICLPFMDYHDLVSYYQASDIGVWPTQESTSMLDAAACGIPIIVNDTIVATERYIGNGLSYKLNKLDDLIKVLLKLSNKELRKKLGEVGAKKMSEDYSWHSLTKKRLQIMKKYI